MIRYFQIEPEQLRFSTFIQSSNSVFRLNFRSKRDNNAKKWDLVLLYFSF